MCDDPPVLGQSFLLLINDIVLAAESDLVCCVCGGSIALGSFIG